MGWQCDQRTSDNGKSKQRTFDGCHSSSRRFSNMVAYTIVKLNNLVHLAGSGSDSQYLARLWQKEERKEDQGE